MVIFTQWILYLNICANIWFGFCVIEIAPTFALSLLVLFIVLVCWSEGIG